MAKTKDFSDKYLRDFIRDSRKSVKRKEWRRHFFLDLLEGALNRNKKTEVKHD